MRLRTVDLAERFGLSPVTLERLASVCARHPAVAGVAIYSRDSHLPPIPASN